MKYQFQKDDLVICKPAESKHNGSNKNFEIYARVAEVDRESDTLRLDSYLKQGRLHQEKRILQSLPLSEMERDEYYQPMNDSEILEFRDNLCAMLTEAGFANRLDAPDVHATFEIANERAEEIEHHKDAELDM